MLVLATIPYMITLMCRHLSDNMLTLDLCKIATFWELKPLINDFASAYSIISWFSLPSGLSYLTQFKVNSWTSSFFQMETSAHCVFGHELVNYFTLNSSLLAGRHTFFGRFWVCLDSHIYWGKQPYGITVIYLIFIQ